MRKAINHLLEKFGEDFIVDYDEKKKYFGNKEKRPSVQVATPFKEISPERYKSYFKLEEVKQKNIRPHAVDVSPKFVQIDDTYFTSIHSKGYGNQIMVGIMNKLKKTNTNFTMVKYINVLSRDAASALLKSNQRELEGERYIKTEGKEYVDTQDIDEKIDTIKAARTEVNSDNRMISFGMGVGVFANETEKLMLNRRSIQTQFREIGIDEKDNDYYQQDALKSFLPNNKFFLPVKELFASNVSAMYSFTDAPFNFSETGLFYGINTETGIPICIDIFKDLNNQNGTIIAGSGAGKTFYVDSAVDAWNSIGYEVYMIDPNSEQELFIKSKKGQYINIGRKGVPNLFDLYGGSRKEQEEAIKEGIQKFIPTLTEQQLAYFIEYVGKIYDDFGIGIDYDVELHGVPEKYPRFVDIFDLIGSDINSIRSKGGKIPTALQNLYGQLRPFAKTSYDYMNNVVDLDWNSDLIGFGIDDVPETVKVD